jgi:DNA-binding transcriptional LysR family regulator
MRKLTFLSIEYFLKVAETLNFTVAARELYISQPALSKQIKQLEEEIGVRLFRRDTKQVELTAGGKILYDEWSKLLKSSENAIGAAKSIEEKQIRKIRVGIAEFNGLIDIIAPILEEFTQMDNNIEVIYEVHGFSQLRRMLEKDEVDLIFSLNTELPSSRKKLFVQGLFDMQLCIILSLKHHLAERETLEVEDLSEETIFMFSEQYSEAARKSVEMHFAKKGMLMHKIQEFPNVRSLELALMNGNGVTLGYQAFFSNAQKFKYYPIQDEIGVHQLVLAWSEEKEKQIHELLDFCLMRKNIMEA